MQLPESISATLESGGVVVAFSARAARALRRQYGDAQRERRVAAWRAPEILHWDGWMEALWQQEQRAGNELRVLLSASQEHRIWVQLIKPDIEGRRLISIEGVADLAQEAYSLLCAYRALDFLRGEIFGGPDIESFREWARSFERQCREQGWLSRSMLPITLSNAVARESRSLPRRVTLIGFDRITPAQQSLIDACVKAGCPVDLFPVPLPDENPQKSSASTLVEAADPREEISLCAWWARRTLDEAALRGNEVRVAVLVSDVNNVRSEIERIFRQVLAPASVFVSTPEHSLPFEFSLGSPLAYLPMVRAALLLLRWMTEGLRREEIAWLMFSGFLWQEESDLLPLAEFDADSRREAILLPEYEMDTFLLGPGWRGNSTRTQLRDRLYAARRAWAERRPETADFSRWVERIRAVLSAAGWPGMPKLTSEDFQVRTKWDQLLESVAALTLEGPPVRYEEFLRVLQREAGQTIFSPESQNAAIQILGPFEAAGIEFDAVWFLGADDASWPAPARPHPFLPQSLQRQYGMPHADDSVDWELAKLITQRIHASTSHCMFSYAMQSKDGKRRPSTALFPRPLTISGTAMRERLTEADGSLENLFHPSPFEDQWVFPPLSVEEEASSGLIWPSRQSPGGQDVLKRQAACPFQAFAHFRLGARDLDTSEWGLDPMERGNLLHKVLQGIWEELKDRDSLIEARTNGRLREIVELHVHRALTERGKGRSLGDAPKTKDRRPEDSWSRAYLQAEKDRVIRLIEDWLAYEERRPPFIVEHCEKSLTAHVGELELRLRADRIDKVESGRLIIDYKSGPVSPSAWMGDRPDEPQLPLYAAYGNVSELRGVLLARVRSGDIRLDGSVSNPNLLIEQSRLPLYTPELRQHWEEVLLTLAREFRSGEARVDPKRPGETCKYCSLPGLCRVAETPRAGATSEIPEEEGGNGEE